MDRQPCVYLMARASHSTLYTGVTSNLIQRVHHHRSGAVPGFTSRYGIKRLVWFELHETMEAPLRARRASSGGRERGNTTLSARRIRRGAIWPKTLVLGRWLKKGGSRLEAGTTISERQLTGLKTTASSGTGSDASAF